MNRTATETVRYVNGNDGSKMADSKTATITYSRTATVNIATGEVTYGAWVADGSDTFPALDSPTVPDYTPDQATVPAFKDDTAADVGLVVYYYPTTVTVTPTDPKNPDTPVDPKNPDGPKYPAGVDQDSLNRTATETVRYVDQNGQPVATSSRQTIHFVRTATVDISTATPTVRYGAWTPATGDGTFASVASPTVKGLTPDRSATGVMADAGPFPISMVVTYFPTVQNIDLTNTKTTGDLLNPDNPDSPRYPGGLTAGDLQMTATRTVHFVDGSGRTVAPDAVESIHYERTAKVDFTNPDNPQVTYGAWIAVGTNGFAAVGVPTIAGMTPDRTIVEAMTFSKAASDTSVTVVYHTTPRHVLPQTGGSVATTTARSLPQTGGTTTPAPTKAARSLPQTGDDHESAASWIGLTVLGMLLGLVGYKKRRDDED
ncbi:mucin-binding protein [Lacticaseibacillus pantheris]|uniref:mucin-binding protein n=1 Tax=Lacticaseibacillus pantheris TaxID=171523 RepID=UPI0026596F85|nr:LPXTG cell wall anchor domain-containing protein [Lacticaseibacillus pantheris]WKF86132.1 LPXTG cell wall anchor domain-containing protein [Lacticaseibacillus pantheris]